MKFSIFILLLVLSIGAIASCDSGSIGSGKAANDDGQNSESKVAAAENKPTENKIDESKKQTGPQVLWDFRKVDLSKPQNFSNAETDAVVKYLFGETNSKIEIRDRVSGSFTKANARETLYYLTGCNDEDTGKFKTDCPHVSWDSAGWIAIFDGTTPVLKIAEGLGFAVEKVTDINGDGKSEILSFSGYAQSGIQTQGMSLGEISDGKYNPIKGFEGFADNCGFGETLSNEKKKAFASVVTVTPKTGGMPDFEEEYFEAGCKNDEIDKSSWKKTTKNAFEEFYNSVS